MSTFKGLYSFCSYRKMPCFVCGPGLDPTARSKMAKKIWGKETCIQVPVFLCWGTITWPAAKVVLLGLNAKWCLPQNLVTGEKNICSRGIHPCFTGRCQGMPSGGCGGRKSSGAGSKQHVWDTRHSSRWRGHALVDKTKEPGRAVAVSSQLLCSSSLLLWEDLSCVLHAEASDAGASWLEVGNDGIYGASFTCALPKVHVPLQVMPLCSDEFNMGSQTTGPICEAS